ncbi:alpha/beta fold hydrolase [Planococcus beigongshangi]|uniref:alpha/beta fold hydrolase n=1 Tax=Planococcus beigongshangi TaxID=2782536 RepID=UPI00193BF94B|nr:alpha/beta hydrolase [Planococcus beigongshangi]
MTNIIKRNNVKKTGSGKETIIFGHGFGCDQLVWKEVIEAFTKDYQVVTFDYVGCGQSDKSAYSLERYGTLHGYKQDLLEVCEALEEESFLYVGHSVSSMIGMLASNERPDLFKKMVMIGPSPHYLNEPDGYQGGFERSDINELLDMMEVNYKEWAKYLAPVVMSNEDRPELAANFEKLLCSNDPKIARQFAEVTFMSDVRADLEKVTVPTLIMLTQDDAIAPMEIGRYVHTQIPGSRLAVMEALGHNPHISDAAETAAVIKDYLSGQGE